MSVINLATYSAPIELDDSGLQKGLKKMDGDMKTKTGSIASFIKTSLITSLAAVGASLGAIGIASIKAASDAEEMRGKFSVVFGDLENETREYAKESAKAWGRSQVAIEGYLAETQNMLVGMGSTREEGAELSKQIVQLGVDLASFNNLAESDALSNLQSAISGNHNASKSLGAVLNENTLAMAMERMQIRGKFQDLDEATKMQVRYNAILMQSEDAVGDAVRTSGSFANQMRRLKSAIADSTAELGASLLPTATNFVSFVTEKIPSIQEFLVNLFERLGSLAEKTWTFFENYIIPVLKLLVDVFNNDVIPIFKKLIEWLRTWLSENDDTINNIKNGFMEFFSVVVEFFQAFISLVSKLWDKYGEDIMNIISKYWEYIKAVFQVAFDYITGIFRIFTKVFQGDWKGAWEEVKKLAGIIWEGIEKLVSTALDTIIAIIQGIGGAMFDAGKAMFGMLWDGIKSVWESIASWVSEKVSWIADKLTFWKKSQAEMTESSTGTSNTKPGLGGISASIPKLSTGSSLIKSDGLAYIHAGEAVVPAQHNPWNPANHNKQSIGESSQVFNIAKLEFPNVRDSNEIQSALVNLKSAAIQHVNKVGR